MYIRHVMLVLGGLLTGFIYSSGQQINNFKYNGEKSAKVYNDIDTYVRDNGYKHRTMAIPQNQVYPFPGLSGPTRQTLVELKKATSWKQYISGGNNRLCIYLRDTNSFWRGLVNGLSSQCIPFLITTDIQQALMHKVVLAYPSMASSNLDQNTFVKLRDFVRGGGALVGFNLNSPALGQLFGFSSSAFSNKRDRIILNSQVSDLVSFAKDPLEKTIRIGNFEVNPNALETCGYSGLEYIPLAFFSDGTAAISRKLYNTGAAYGFGLDLGFFTLFGQANLDPVYQNSYVNGFEPTLDVLYRIIKNIYIMHATTPVLPGLVPGNKSVAITITHDVDTKDAIKNSLLYAELENKNGVKATYFLQTKYIKDGQDEAFFSLENLDYVKALINMGMEVGSHSVSHTPFFSYLPLGDGDEAYPTYQPYYVTNFSTFNETLLGELRVSKFLLDSLLGNNTVSFRAGYLGRSVEMYPALQACRYRYSSCVTANDVLTHMPFQAFYDNTFDSQISVYEFPVTIEDEEQPPMNERVSSAIFLTDKIAPYGGLMSILIHPNERNIKFAFEKEYIEHYRDEAWFGTVGEYGDWWVARSKMQIDASIAGNSVTVKIACPMLINNIPLQIPSNMRLSETVPPGIRFEVIPEGLLFDSLSGLIQLIFELD